MPSPGGLSIVEAAVERGHAVGEAAQAGAAGGVGAATAVVAHLDDQAAVVVAELDLDAPSRSA